MAGRRGRGPRAGAPANRARPAGYQWQRPGGAPLFDYKGPVVEERDFTKQFPVDLLLKDLDLIVEAAERRGVYLPQTAATREAVNGAKALGHGDEDMAAILKLLEAVSGTTVGAAGAEEGS